MYLKLIFAAAIIFLIASGFEFSTKPLKFTLKYPMFGIGWLLTVAGLIIIATACLKYGYREGINENITEWLEKPLKP